MSENSSTVPLQPDDKGNDKPNLAELIFKLLDLDPDNLRKAREMLDCAIAMRDGTPTKDEAVTVPITPYQTRTMNERLEALSWSLYGQLIHHFVLEKPNMHGSAKAEDIVEHIKHVTDSIYLSLVGAGLDINEP